MRNALKYGIPAAAGLGAAGLIASQGGNPVEAGIGAAAAGLGGAAGLVAARQLAGKYNPQLMARMRGAMDAPRGESGQSLRQRVETGVRQSPEYRERGPSQTLYDPRSIGNRARTALLEAPASIGAAAPAGLAAGLGGVVGTAVPSCFLCIFTVRQDCLFDPSLFFTGLPSLPLTSLHTCLVFGVSAGASAACTANADNPNVTANNSFFMLCPL